MNSSGFLVAWSKSSVLLTWLVDLAVSKLAGTNDKMCYAIC